MRCLTRHSLTVDGTSVVDKDVDGDAAQRGLQRITHVVLQHVHVGDDFHLKTGGMEDDASVS